MAEWIIDGAPKSDLWSFDVRRFVGLHNNRMFLQVCFFLFFFFLFLFFFFFFFLFCFLIFYSTSPFAPIDVWEYAKISIYIIMNLKTVER